MSWNRHSPRRLTCSRPQAGDGAVPAAGQQPGPGDERLDRLGLVPAPGTLVPQAPGPGCAVRSRSRAPGSSRGPAAEPGGGTARRRTPPSRCRRPAWPGGSRRSGGDGSGWPPGSRACPHGHAAVRSLPRSPVNSQRCWSHWPGPPASRSGGRPATLASPRSPGRSSAPAAPGPGNRRPGPVTGIASPRRRPRPPGVCPRRGHASTRSSRPSDAWPSKARTTSRSVPARTQFVAAVCRNMCVRREALEVRVEVRDLRR